MNVKGYAVDGDDFLYLPADYADGCLVDSSQVSYFDRVQNDPLGLACVCSRY